MESNNRRSQVVKNIGKLIIIGLLVNSMGVANSYNDTKLWNSAETGAVGGIGYFKGMDVNIKNDKGQTPLMIAVQKGYADVVRSMAEGTASY